MLRKVLALIIVSVNVVPKIKFKGVVGWIKLFFSVSTKIALKKTGTGAKIGYVEKKALSILHYCS
jgi:hypothetical protein